MRVGFIKMEIMIIEETNRWVTISGFLLLFLAIVIYTTSVKSIRIKYLNQKINYLEQKIKELQEVIPK